MRFRMWVRLSTWLNNFVIKGRRYSAIIRDQINDYNMIMREVKSMKNNRLWKRKWKLQITNECFCRNQFAFIDYYHLVECHHIKDFFYYLKYRSLIWNEVTAGGGISENERKLQRKFLKQDRVPSLQSRRHCDYASKLFFNFILKSF